MRQQRPPGSVRGAAGHRSSLLATATPNPGSREVLADGRFGRLAEDTAFGPTMLELLGNQSSRRALEASGLRRAEELSLNVMLDRYETLLATLCGAHARSTASA